MLSEGSEWEDLRQVAWRILFVGFMASQVAALSMAFVFALGRFVWRLTRWWSVGGALLVCWLIGYGARRVDEYLWDVPFSLPLAALIAQAPLWALRSFCGWRWERNGDAPATTEVRWSLADLLIGTAMVAVSLALVRFVSYSLDDGFWMSWAYFAVFTVAVEPVEHRDLRCF